jgi:predicted secreted protein
MTRNEIKNKIKINISVSNASQNKLCNEVFVLSDKKWYNSFFKKMEYNYKKEKNYEKILYEILNPWRLETEEKEISISEFNLKSICLVSKYLDIETKFESSLNITKNKKEIGLIDITKSFGCDTYVNPIGGEKLYNKEFFKEFNVDLYFIKMNEITTDNYYVSILDLLFRYDKNLIKEQLNNYTLI